MKLETVVVLVKIVENVLEIVQKEHPEIITRAIAKTLKENESK